MLMKKFLLLFTLALLTMPTMFANNITFYFQDGDDDIELDNPQSLVTIWNETDGENVDINPDVAFLNYEFEPTKMLRIEANDFDYEVTVECEDEDGYDLEKNDNQWFLTLYLFADNLEFTIRVYTAGSAPSQGASEVEVSFDVQAASGSGIQDVSQTVNITYFDLSVFQEVPVELNTYGYGSTNVKPGTNFEIKPVEGYVVKSISTFQSDLVSISEPGVEETTWNVSVSWDPEGSFAYLNVTVDKVGSDEPVVDPLEAKITQIEPLQWKVEWPSQTFISQVDPSINDIYVYLTNNSGQKTTLYPDLRDEYPNPSIFFPAEWGNYFTINLEKQNLANGEYTLTIPEGYVELGESRTPNSKQDFQIEVGGEVENDYAVIIGELDGNTIDIEWENVTQLTEGKTEGAYMRNVMESKDYPLYYLEDYMYSKANLRIDNSNKLRVNIINNYPDLPSGIYELYIPAGYVKFNGTETTNAAIEGHMFVYTALRLTDNVEFDYDVETDVVTAQWVDAVKIEYNTDYKGDGQNVSGVTLYDSQNTISLDYPDDFSIEGNTLSVNLSNLPLTAGEVRLLIPEECLNITFPDVVYPNFSESFVFVYGNPEEEDKYEFYEGEVTWSHNTGDTVEGGTYVEVSWGGNKLSLVEEPENCSVDNREITGVVDLKYGEHVTLSDDQTKLLISLSHLPEATYRVNVAEACVYIEADGKKYVNHGVSTDGLTTGIESVVADAKDGHFTVVGLNGVVILDTDNAAELQKLPRGFYIINGQKVVK